MVLPGILVTLAAVYPFIEAKMTKDTAKHHLLQRPRDVPVRTSLGVMALTFYLVLFLSGGNDLIAKAFDISLNAMTWGGRILLLTLPPIAYAMTYRICLGLQRHDREVLEHGLETGIIKVLPTGEFIEVHQPLGPVDEHGHGTADLRRRARPEADGPARCRVAAQARPRVLLPGEGEAGDPGRARRARGPRGTPRSSRADERRKELTD